MLGPLDIVVMGRRALTIRSVSPWVKASTGTAVMRKRAAGRCCRAANSPVASDQGRQALHGFRVLLDQPDQRGGLGIGFGPALFPVFQGPGVGAQVQGEYRP